jgi:hypothetical protein
MTSCNRRLPPPRALKQRAGCCARHQPLPAGALPQLLRHRQARPGNQERDHREPRTSHSPETLRRPAHRAPAPHQRHGSYSRAPGQADLSTVSPATRAALEHAMQRLIEGRPARTDGALTIANLAREAGVSRATANRASDILARLRDQRDTAADGDLPARPGTHAGEPGTSNRTRKERRNRAHERPAEDSRARVTSCYQPDDPGQGIDSSTAVPIAVPPHHGTC